MEETNKAKGTSMSNIRKYVPEGKPVLHLTLKKKWFDMIQSQIKLEEYREIKQYYTRIFVDGKIKIKGKYYHPADVVVLFSNGYLKNRRQMLFYIGWVTVSHGIEKWGAEQNKQYFAIRLGEIIATTDPSIKIYQIKKIREVDQPRHPGNIPVGFTKTGVCKDPPKVGKRFEFGQYWSTSIVTEILFYESPFNFDDCIFQTLNSVYQISKLNIN